MWAVRNGLDLTIQCGLYKPRRGHCLMKIVKKTAKSLLCLLCLRNILTLATAWGTLMCHR